MLFASFRIVFDLYAGVFCLSCIAGLYKGSKNKGETSYAEVRS
jgi:hypothetical protein